MAADGATVVRKSIKRNSPKIKAPSKEEKSKRNIKT